MLLPSEIGGGEEIYNEGEHKIGTFLGKDLYRRVIKLNVLLSQDTAYTYNYPYSRIDGHIVNSYAILDNTTNMYIACNTSNFGQGACYYQRAKNAFYIKQNATGSIYIKALIVEYTKETWN